MNVKMRRGVTWQDRDEVVVFKDAYSQPFLQKWASLRP